MFTVLRTIKKIRLLQSEMGSGHNKSEFNPFYSSVASGLDGWKTKLSEFPLFFVSFTLESPFRFPRKRWFLQVIQYPYTFGLRCTTNPDISGPMYIKLVVVFVTNVRKVIVTSMYQNSLEGVKPTPPYD